MTEQEAINRALHALAAQGLSLANRPIHAKRLNRTTGPRRDKTGWLIYVPLNVPEGLEPDEVLVDVYEPDGEIYIPMTL